jgi:hypothetical protein
VAKRPLVISLPDFRNRAKGLGAELSGSGASCGSQGRRSQPPCTVWRDGTLGLAWLALSCLCPAFRLGPSASPLPLALAPSLGAAAPAMLGVRTVRMPWPAASPWAG